MVVVAAIGHRRRQPLVDQGKQRGKQRGRSSCRAKRVASALSFPGFVRHAGQRVGVVF